MKNNNQSHENLDVFLCPLCKIKYSKDNNPPMCLDCGDVLCLLCIKKLTKKSKEIICPFDNQKLLINFNKLETCKTILDYLPNNQISVFHSAEIKNSNNNDNIGFYCKNHPLKKVKFYCENDDCAFCSNCISLHNKHKINNFNPSKNIISEEIKTILYGVNMQKDIIKQNKNALQKSKDELNNKLVENIKYINEQIQNIIDVLQENKNKLINNLKANYQNKLNEIDKLLNKINSFDNNIKKTCINFSDILDNFHENKSIVYDELNQNKKIHVANWENLLIELNKYQIAMKTKIKNLLNYDSINENQNGNNNFFFNVKMNINNTIFNYNINLNSLNVNKSINNNSNYSRHKNNEIKSYRKKENFNFPGLQNVFTPQKNQSNIKLMNNYSNIKKVNFNNNQFQEISKNINSINTDEKHIKISIHMSSKKTGISSMGSNQTKQLFNSTSHQHNPSSLSNYQSIIENNLEN